MSRQQYIHFYPGSQNFQTHELIKLNVSKQSAQQMVLHTACSPVNFVLSCLSIQQENLYIAVTSLSHGALQDCTVIDLFGKCCAVRYLYRIG